MTTDIFPDRPHAPGRQPESGGMYGSSLLVETLQRPQGTHRIQQILCSKL
jgi:hypothetical protein